MAHKFVIRKSANGEHRAYFEYNGEKIFWTEGYSSQRPERDRFHQEK